MMRAKQTTVRVLSVTPPPPSDQVVSVSTLRKASSRNLAVYDEIVSVEEGI